MDKRSFEFLFYGLTAAWLIVFVYVFTILRRSRQLRDKLAQIEASRGN